MPGVSAEQIKLAREVDLLTYLQTNEPHELRRSGPNEYRTVSHGSLVISNGLWIWNRGQVAGRSALDYLIKVRSMGFTEAVDTILGSRTAPAITLPAGRKERERKPLTLPPPARFSNHMVGYLQDRGIDPSVIRQCIGANVLFEGRYDGSPVCVFVGHDEIGKPRFACMRGIYSDLKRDCSGSDKRFSFQYPARNLDDTSLSVFESPIDALSHACLFPDYDGARLSLGGTSEAALTAFLARSPQITAISLCLDNDEAGQTAAVKIRDTLAKRHPHIAVIIDPPSEGKDYSDMLLRAKALERERAYAGHRKEAGVSL